MIHNYQNNPLYISAYQTIKKNPLECLYNCRCLDPISQDSNLVGLGGVQEFLETTLDNSGASGEQSLVRKLWQNAFWFINWLKLLEGDDKLEFEVTDYPKLFHFEVTARTQATALSIITS